MTIPVYRLNQSSGEYDSIGIYHRGYFIDEGLSMGWSIVTGYKYRMEACWMECCSKMSTSAIPTAPLPWIPFAPCPPTSMDIQLCDSGYNHLSWKYYRSLLCSGCGGLHALYYSPTFERSLRLSLRIRGAATIRPIIITRKIP